MQGGWVSSAVDSTNESGRGQSALTTKEERSLGGGGSWGCLVSTLPLDYTQIKDNKTELCGPVRITNDGAFVLLMERERKKVRLER